MKIETDDTELLRRADQEWLEREEKYALRDIEEQVERAKDGELPDGSPCACTEDGGMMTWRKLTACARRGHRASMREMRAHLEWLLETGGSLDIDADLFEVRFLP
jgi:hypothetical protein